MTLPALITVKATIRDQDGPVAGRISFVRSATIFPASSSDANLAIPDVIETTVGVDGVLAQPLYASNDPAASPTGWTWEVRPQFPNWRSSFSIVVPYNAPGGEINLNQLAPVPPNGDGDLYALVNHTHSGGGGGGGAVESVFGRTGVVLAQSGDYTKSQVGLGNVDNTADSVKVVAAANQLRRTVYYQGSVALGDPLVVTGVNGSNIQVNKANASSLSTLPAIGLAAAAYGGGQVGEMVMYGSQPGWNTGTWAINDLLYVAEGGGLTKTSPPNSQIVGLVLRTGGGDGVIGINPQAVARVTTYYWNGSAYVPAFNAASYVGGSGPGAPVNGDVVFPT